MDSFKALTAALGGAALVVAGTAAWIGFGNARSQRSIEKPRAAARAVEEPFRESARTAPRTVIVPVTHEVTDRKAEKPAPDTAESEAEPLSYEDQRAYYDVTFPAEPVDRGWVHATEPSLRAGLVRLETKVSRLGRVECRSVFCRAEITHDGEGDAQAYVRSIIDEKFTLWKGPLLWDSKPGDGGRYATVVYFSRTEQFPSIQ